MAESMMQEAVAATANALRKEMNGDFGERGTDGRVDGATVESILGNWQEVPQKVARTMLDQYGPPNEATTTRLIWYSNGPWKRSIVYRDEIPHDFPKPHTDVLEQFIDYRVPPQKFSDLAAYDGSVIPERTKGEISARCDMEPMNFLALNLAHDVITGAKSVEDARKTYAETATAFMSGESARYAEGFVFDVAHGGTNDTDQIASGPMINEMMDKARQLVGSPSGG